MDSLAKFLQRGKVEAVRNGGSMANLRIESHAFDEVAGRFVPWAALLSGSGDGITGQLPQGQPEKE